MNQTSTMPTAGPKVVAPPANIMYSLAQEEAEQQVRFTHARRNDPYPCGSGRKFKQCHGRR